MSKAVDHNYTEDEFLELVDTLDGAALTLEQTVDRYVDTLGEYITDETNEFEFKHSVSPVIDSLERVYDSLDSLDQMVEDETLKAHVKRGNKKGVCDLEKNLSRLSNGAYNEIESFNDLLTLVHWLNEDEDLEADIQSSQGESLKPDAPTRMVYDRERLLQIEEKLNLQYRRLAYTEVLARRKTETESSIETYSPEPPIFQMLDQQEYSERTRKLNKKMRKNL